MSVMRTMQSGVSGLRAETGALSVVGDNIANTNTVGFKYSRAQFEDVLGSVAGQKMTTGGAGVRMVRGHLEKALARHGVTLIDALGRPFDPGAHEAVDIQVSADHPPDTVIRQWSRGVHLNGRLVRAAQVVVSAAPVARDVAEAEEVSPPDRDLSTAVTLSAEE